MKAAALQEVTDWLIDGARSATSPIRLMAETCERLVAAGMPLWRVAVFVRTLHPDIYGRAFFWRPGAEVVMNPAGFEVQDSPEYRRSPLAILYDTAREVRYRLDDPGSRRFPFFDDMRGEGVTDYIALPLLFIDGSTHGSSWTTKQPGGFGDDELAALRAIVRPLTRIIEIVNLRRTSLSLLDNYVGNSAGERIMGGQIRRGHTDTLHAAIWLSDLRGFTALSDRLPAETVVDILNHYFDCQVSAIRDHGGEVLKFMGDGLLAVFPIAEGRGQPPRMRPGARGRPRIPRQRRGPELSDRRDRRAISFRRRAACRQDSLRQYRRRQPARLHLHRSRRQSRSKAGEDRWPPQPYHRGVGRLCRHLRRRLVRTRRIPDRGIYQGRAGLWAGGRGAGGVAVLDAGRPRVKSWDHQVLCARWPRHVAASLR
jgi:adenylate cyclase